MVFLSSRICLGVAADFSRSISQPKLWESKIKNVKGTHIYTSENRKYRLCPLFSETEAQTAVEPQSSQVNLEVIRLDLQASIFDLSRDK